MSKLSKAVRSEADIAAAEVEPTDPPVPRFLSAVRVENTNTCRLSYHIPPAPDAAAGVGAPLKLYVISRPKTSPDVDPFEGMSDEDVVTQAEVDIDLTVDNLDQDVSVDIKNDLDRNAEKEASICVLQWDDAA